MEQRVDAELAHLPPSARRQLEDIVRLLYENTASRPLGVYLHGSAALGCFHPAHSDLDVLALTALPTAPEQRRRWAAGLMTISRNPHPVEISIVHDSQCRPWQHPTPYDFHFSEAWRARYAAWLADPAAEAWQAPAEPDPDLAAHFTIVRRRGICLAGAAIAEAVPAVPWTDYLDSITRDLTWAAERAGENPVYAVLNACRVWAAYAEGLVLSKAEGAAWAMPRLPMKFREVVGRAAAVSAGEEGVRVRAEAAEEVVRWVVLAL